MVVSCAERLTMIHAVTSPAMWDWHRWPLDYLQDYTCLYDTTKITSKHIQNNIYCTCYNSNTNYSESCQLSNADLRSLDFTFNRLFMKLFKTKSTDVVKACQSFTGSEVPSCVLKRKTDKFILRFNCVENTVCNFCSST